MEPSAPLRGGARRSAVTERRTAERRADAVVGCWIVVALLVIGGLTVSALLTGPSARPIRVSPDRTAPAVVPVPPALDTWPAYLQSPERTAYNPNETYLSTGDVAELKLNWTFTTTGHVRDIASSAAVANGSVFVGSWNGNEYALNATTGSEEWQTNLTNLKPNPSCPGQGITSSATYSNGVVYVAGGANNLTALNAGSGRILWNASIWPIQDREDYYNWASPLVYNGSAYIGTASVCDDPLIQGQLIQVNLGTHTVSHVFNATPSGRHSNGSAIWGAATVLPSLNRLYVVTGNNGTRGTLGPAIIALLPSNVSKMVDEYTLPPNASLHDDDFGNTPTPFLVHGAWYLLVGNKNGIIYAFNASNLAAGPVWTYEIAVGGDDPTAGDGSISPGSNDGSAIFYAGGKTTLGGTAYAGSVRAFALSTTRTLRWSYGANGSVLGGLASADGFVVAAAGDNLIVLNASTGSLLYSYNFSHALFAAPTIANHMIYEGATNGVFDAFGLVATAPPPRPGVFSSTNHACDGVTKCTTASLSTIASSTVLVGIEAASGTAPTSVTDSGGHTWIADGRVPEGTSTEVSLYHTDGVAQGSLTVTARFASNTVFVLSAADLEQLNATSLDAVGAGSVSPGSTTVTATVTTSRANDLVLIVAGVAGFVSMNAHGGDANVKNAQAGLGSVEEHGGIFDRVVVAPGSVTLTILTNKTAPWAALAIAFAPAHADPPVLPAFGPVANAAWHPATALTALAARSVRDP